MNLHDITPIKPTLLWIWNEHKCSPGCLYGNARNTQHHECARKILVTARYDIVFYCCCTKCGFMDPRHYFESRGDKTICPACDNFNCPVAPTRPRY